MNNREIAEHCTNTIWKHISEGTYNDLIDAITQALDEKDRYKDEFCEALLEDKKSIVSILKAENTAIREERGDTLTDQLRQGWLCFHCGERFHTFGAAEDHFGATPESVAGCLIITSEDRGILMALRRTEAQVATLREALVKAEQFIDNGIELGYIHLPDPGIGDTATDTPKAIREALAVLATSQDNDRVMDLIRHCLDLSAQDEKLRMSFNDRKYCPTCNQNKRNYEEGTIGSVTCYAHNAEKSKTTQLVEALPPHIIERARNRKGE